MSTRRKTAGPASNCTPRATARRRSATTKGSSSIPRPGTAGRRRLPAAGFTLIEIVLVLVVFGVAAVLVAPALQPALQAVRGEAAARRTGSFLDELRRRAVLERKIQRVSCRADENRLVLLLEGEASAESSTVFPIPQPVQIASCRPEEAQYYPQGYASGLAIVLRDERGQEYAVTVGTFTGLSRVEREP